MKWHIAYFLSGINSVARLASNSCFQNTTILNVLPQIDCFKRNASNHLLSCYNNTDAFTEHALFDIGELGGHDAKRCKYSPCFMINVDASQIDLRTGDQITLHVDDPDTVLMRAYTLFKGHEQPWTRNIDKNVFTRCPQFADPPSTHWFKPSFADLRKDTELVLHFMTRTTFQQQMTLLKRATDIGIPVRVEHVVSNAEELSDLEKIPEPTPNVTAYLTHASCRRLSRFGETLGFGAMRCVGGDLTWKIEIIFASFFLCLVIIASTAFKRETVNHEVVPLNK